jgi:hypothetical protein
MSLTAYTLRTAMYDGAMSRYWINDVIMCHGSNCQAITSHSISKMRKTIKDARTKINDAMTYSPSVANKDRTMFRNIGLMKMSENCNGRPRSLAILPMPLKASKNAAVYGWAVSGMSITNKVERLTVI